MNYERSKATRPFQVYALAHVTRIVRQDAWTVAELLQGLAECPDECVYHHMVESPVSEESSSTANDFAKWVYEIDGCQPLAERLMALDERCYTSLNEMRDDLRSTISSYAECFPACLQHRAAYGFRFREEVALSVPLNIEARTLAELRNSIEAMGNESFYLHFVATAAREALRSNDFSIWLADSLGMKDLARKLNEIDLADNTLDDAKQLVLRLMDDEPATAFSASA